MCTATPIESDIVYTQADEVLALNSKREFVIIQDKRKDGEIWVSLKQQEVRSSICSRMLVPCNPSGPGVCYCKVRRPWCCSHRSVADWSCVRFPAQYALAWHRIRQMSQEDIKVEVLVVGANRGGIIVSVDHIRGFIPGSHLTQVGHRARVQHWIIRGLPLVAERCMHQQQPHGGCPVSSRLSHISAETMTSMLRLCSQSTLQPTVTWCFPHGKRCCALLCA
jgi:hypothetical protein